MGRGKEDAVATEPTMFESVNIKISYAFWRIKRQFPRLATSLRS